MEKSEVVKIMLSESSEKQKFSELVMALSKAEHPNLTLVSHYNRSGYSKSNFSTLVYDVKKAFNIKASDMRVVTKKEKVDVATSEASTEEVNSIEVNAEEVIAEEVSTEKTDLELANEKLAEIDLSSANYHQEIVPLANELAQLLNLELPGKSKAVLVSFLEEQKKSLGQQA